MMVHITDSTKRDYTNIECECDNSKSLYLIVEKYMRQYGWDDFRACQVVIMAQDGLFVNKYYTESAVEKNRVVKELVKKYNLIKIEKDYYKNING